MIVDPNVKEGWVPMRYMIAWLLGVPISILVLWFLVVHVL
jgi:hypothetical protein